MAQEDAREVSSRGRKPKSRADDRCPPRLGMATAARVWACHAGGCMTRVRVRACVYGTQVVNAQKSTNGGVLRPNPGAQVRLQSSSSPRARAEVWTAVLLCCAGQPPRLLFLAKCLLSSLPTPRSLPRVPSTTRSQRCCSGSTRASQPCTALRRAHSRLRSGAHSEDAHGRAWVSVRRRSEPFSDCAAGSKLSASASQAQSLQRSCA
jgi:hypothetical protein